MNNTGLYEVYVTNLGKVESGGRDRCQKAFRTYCRDSKAGYGRAGGESVTLFKSGKVVKEFVGINTEDQS